MRDRLARGGTYLVEVAITIGLLVWAHFTSLHGSHSIAWTIAGSGFLMLIMLFSGGVDLKETDGSRWRWVRREFAADGYMLCIYICGAGIVWTVIYHHPARWLALTIAVASAGIVARIVILNGPLAKNSLSARLEAPTCAGLLFWCMAGAIAGHGDLRTLAIIGAALSASPLVVKLIHWWRRRTHSTNASD